MKIQNIAGQQPVSKVNAKTDGADSSGAFRQLLDDRLQAISEAKKVAAADRASTLDTPASLRLQGLEMTDYALQTLADYGSALADPAIESRDLEPFVSALEEETSGLLSLRDQFPADDPLAGLLDRVAAVTFLESAKYRRGDYAA